MSVVPIAMLAVYFSDYSSSRERELANGRARLRSFSHMYAEEVSRSFAGVDLLVDELANMLDRTPDWADWQEARGHELLRAHKPRSLPQLRNTAIFDATGRQRFHSSRFPSPGTNVADRPYFIELRDGAKRASFGPYKGRNSGVMTYALAQRIDNQDGGFAGIAFAAFELAQFQSACWNGKTESKLQAFLVNKAGIIIAECRPAEEVFSGISAIGQSLTTRYPRMRQLDWRIDGASLMDGQLVSVRRILDYAELSVVATLSEDAVLVDWLAAQRRNHLILCMALVVMLGSFWFILTRIRQQRRTERKVKRINHLLTEDIKVRKQVEQALASSEERARERADLSSDWHWEQDEHFRYISHSPNMEERYSQMPGPILGITRWDGPVDPDASDWAMHRAMLESHQTFRNFEFKMQIDGLPVRWLSSSGKPVFDANGRFKGYRGTGRNISVRKAAEEALRHSRLELRKLADHQEVVRENERKRIARDIHDDLGQNLLVLKMDVAMLHARTGHAHPKLNKRASLVLSNIDATIKSVKSIMNDLRPVTLELGLYPAVEWQLKQFQRMSGVSYKLSAESKFRLDEIQTSAIFRILQESLSNVARHAAATEVEVELNQDERSFFMSIKDNGKGLLPGDRKKTNSFGLMGIRERIDGLGGKLTISGSPGNGTTLSILLDTG